MRSGWRSGAAVISLVAGICPAFGQGAAQNPAMQNPSVQNPDAAAPVGIPPKPGANSFTDGQARKLIESRGYTGVSALVTDKTGIWHGTAKNGLNSVFVTVDYQGNVAAYPQ
jgi:hypothetical protein